MSSATTTTRWSGWSFPARITAVFLLVAAIAMGILTLDGLRQFARHDDEHTATRIERAARAAFGLVGATLDDARLLTEPDGDPIAIEIGDADALVPAPGWDELVDRIGSMNQGAASLFRFDTGDREFDRIATTFTTANGERTGRGAVEPGLIAAGHPAYADLVAGRRYVGEVPAAGRSRYTSLVPILDPEHGLVGALAVDVGWADDLGLIDDELRSRALLTTSVLLLALALASAFVMFLVFRPLNRLIRVAQDVGAGAVPPEIPLRHRRDEIGDLANALTRVVELHHDLARRAFHDPLTGLPNRAHFLYELERRIGSAPDGDAFALLIIDLDQFKEVNDGLGHATGDELLTEVASTLADALQPGEFLARLGGDEFALITGPVEAEIDADAVANRIAQTVGGVTTTSLYEIGVTCSIGIVLIPDQADTVDLAYSHADLALYRAKRAGRANWQFYQSTLASPVQRRLHLASELRRALHHHHELRLDYQPIFDTRQRRIRGFEALARWDHPTEGPIPPGEFVSAAEKVGLINELGTHVLELACAQSSAWRSAGFEVPPVSVNVSTIQLWQQDFDVIVSSMLDRHGLAPSAICLEITESVLVHHADGRTREVLERLARAGVKLSVDDFGTGYSSLGYLSGLAVHQVKIDRVFVTGARPDSREDRLFAGIAALGRSLGLTIVAEGIETDDELDLAVRHGCDLAQGYLLGRPLRSERAVELLGDPDTVAAPTP